MRVLAVQESLMVNGGWNYYLDLFNYKVGLFNENGEFGFAILGPTDKESTEFGLGISNRWLSLLWYPDGVKTIHFELSLAKIFN